MSGTGRFARSRGPGYAPWPRFMVVRVNDLVPVSVPLQDVMTALRSDGIDVATRRQPAGPRVQAVVSPTAAGTIVTLEQRTSLWGPRGPALRRLSRRLERLVQRWPEGPELRQSRTKRT